MRIVGGKYRGRTLNEFSGQNIRPTADKVRESLFNIIQFSVSGCSFLDLYCGTGAMGIEALSRGAGHVVFNDNSKDSINLLRKNLEKLKITEGYKISFSDALNYIEKSADNFDFIYIDPPYRLGVGVKAVENSARILKDCGMIILEDEKPFVEDCEGLKVVDERKYGRVFLTFFKKERG